MAFIYHLKYRIKGYFQIYVQRGLINIKVFFKIFSRYFFFKTFYRDGKLLGTDTLNKKNFSEKNVFQIIVNICILVVQKEFVSINFLEALFFF